MPTMKGYIFIGLNVVRALSIITLILLFASSIVTMVHDIQAVNSFIAAGRADPNIRIAADVNATSSSLPDCVNVDTDYVEETVPNQAAGAFWAVLNRLLIIFQAIVLILSEVGWPMASSTAFSPSSAQTSVSGRSASSSAYSRFLCGRACARTGHAVGTLAPPRPFADTHPPRLRRLGAAVLSHHVDEFALVSAFFLFSVGCLNIFLGLIFRESAKTRRSLSAPVPRPLHMGSGAWEKEREAYTNRSDSLSSQKSGMGFGRQGEKAAQARGFMLQRPSEALPDDDPQHPTTPRRRMQRPHHYRYHEPAQPPRGP
ncbi:uncharacterized protein BXZ73DRAFT_104600 [Epithele typhae]|uniref:uncharacterized protein n=1 Tax=Epithele typhae TaxID=378194 RepID=UPI0020075D1F|nr:uncharacterized protein BXZ73DRAFT_104600 [Epithele typhae]KAH9920866.1 hypothetical protein BXZ73DRAFT_104600 [Epithele typhae]